MNSIETKNVNIAYGNVNIVEDLNLEIPKGKITTIIGANGCGKSTILKTIARILKAKSGDIYINSKNINEQSSKEIARNMAVLPQSPQAPGGLTVEELIAYGRFPHQSGFKNNKQEDKEIVDWALKATGISEFRDRKIEDLSGGQRQRAWIAMALAQQTDILVLDEPTTYLDLAHQLEVLEVLDELNKNNSTQSKSAKTTYIIETYELITGVVVFSLVSKAIALLQRLYVNLGIAKVRIKPDKTNSTQKSITFFYKNYIQTAIN